MALSRDYTPFIEAARKQGIPDDQIKAKIYEAEGVTASAPKQERGLLSKGLGVVSRVLDVPSSIVGGSMKGAREAVTGEYKAPQTGLKINGLDIGEALPPTVVEAGRSLKNLVTGKDYNPVMTELPKVTGVDPNSLAGMALGLAGEIGTPDPLDFLKLGKFGAKATQKAVTKTGEAVEKGGEELVVRGLKASKSQVNKFAEKTGKKLSEFMGENGITSDFVERSAQKIDELQNSFDDIALRSDIKISPEDLTKRFSTKVDEYADSVLPEMKSKAENIKQVGENLAQKYSKELPTQATKGVPNELESAKAFLKNNVFSDYELEGYMGIDPKYEPQGISREVWKQAAKEVGFDPKNLQEFNVKDSTTGFPYKQYALKFSTQATKGGGISIADLTKERRSVDSLLKEGQFSLPVEQSSYLRSVRDVLQETIQDYTSEVKVGGKGLRQIGLELRNMFEFQKIAKQQAGLGKGTNLFGLGDLLTAAVGLPGGVQWSIGMVALKKLAQQPKVLEGASKTFGAIGRAAQSSASNIGKAAGYSFDALRRAGRTLIRQPNRD